MPNVSFNNYSFGVPSTTFDQHNNTFQIIDNVSKTVGTHTFQFGGDVHYDQIDLNGFTAENGQFAFTGAETGIDFADFLIGAPSTFIQGSPDIEHTRSKYYGLYAQDSWRAWPSLTLNYGLRWEASTPWYDKQNYIETLIVGEQSQVFPTAPTGLVVPGDPGVPRTLAPTRYGNFAPRFGLAYSPRISNGCLGKDSGRAGKHQYPCGVRALLSIHSAGGYGAGDWRCALRLLLSKPYSAVAHSPFIDRTTGNLEPNDFPFHFLPRTCRQESGYKLSLGSGRADQRRKLLLQQEYSAIFPGLRIIAAAPIWQCDREDSSYVGTAGHKLLTFVESNPGDQALCLQFSNPANVQAGSPTCGPFGENGVYTLANGTQVINSTRAPFGPNFGSNAYMKSMANSSYNSFQASLQHSEKYVQFMLAYTWGKSMDNGSGTLDATNPYNPRKAGRYLSSMYRRTSWRTTRSNCPLTAGPEMAR